MHSPSRLTLILDAHILLHPHNLVIIRYLYIVRMAISPHEAHTELVIDGNTVLAFPVVAQFFESVTGRNLQILHSYGRVKHSQFLSGRFSEVRRGHSLTFSRIPELFCAFVSESLNQRE